MSRIGVLLTNTGTPDAPTAKAVRRYLREFLSDKRIVQLPRAIWLPILYGPILTFRPKKSAALYQNIWTRYGAPMRVIMRELQRKLSAQFNHEIIIEIGMNYGNPSIRQALIQLREQKVDRVIVLPLFPQFSHTTTSSSLDRIQNALAPCPQKPKMTIIKSYADDDAYIQALAAQVRQSWQQHGKGEHLLMSFHGIPERFVKNGDPYQQECEKTAQKLAQALQLESGAWTLCYQSQFGYDKWLQPSTSNTLQELAKRGVQTVDITCPGFSIDCLETLEEIAIQYTELFHSAGGKTVHYIPALNDSTEHVNMLAELIKKYQHSFD